jgi:hypothetical protein
MTVPVWTLVGFATWTVLLLLTTVGVYRWSRILTGRVPIRSFRADQVEGADWYIRDAGPCELRRKPSGFWLNCFWAVRWKRASAFVNVLAVVVLVARIMQSLVHVCFVQTNTVASVRFGFFFVQIVSFLWLTGILLTKLSGSA